MTPRLAVVLCLGLMSAAAALARATAAPAPGGPQLTAEDIDRATKLVNDHVGKLNARGAQPQRVADEPVQRALPGHVFFALVFRQFPVAIQPPEPLKSQNIFVVKDGKLQHLTDAKGLEAFFKSALPACPNDNAMKDAARAWLRLAQELHQDGFFKFMIPEDSLTVTPEKDGKKVTGKVTVDPSRGDKGEISATLTFDAAGRLLAVTATGKLLAGIRPRCQATKLLDPDPVVRAMAEQDILVMGRTAQEYLAEQRAKASPELRQAIDRLWRRILEEGR